MNRLLSLFGIERKLEKPVRMPVYCRRCGEKLVRMAKPKCFDEYTGEVIITAVILECPSFFDLEDIPDDHTRIEWEEHE